MFPNFPTDNFVKFVTLLCLAGSIYFFTSVQDGLEKNEQAVKSFDNESMTGVNMMYKVDHADLLNEIKNTKTIDERKKIVHDFNWRIDTIHQSSRLGIAYEIMYIDSTAEIVNTKLRKTIDDIQDLEQKMIYQRPVGKLPRSISSNLVAAAALFLAFLFSLWIWFHEQKQHDKLLELQIKQLERTLETSSQRLPNQDSTVSSPHVDEA